MARFDHGLVGPTQPALQSSSQSVRDATALLTAIEDIINVEGFFCVAVERLRGEDAVVAMFF